ncbi:MAG: hypothetical protein J5635_02805 [Paludibacteraceae bacterium]|nr:hypothetical protein [Paludibacteraceae bacterium]
MQKTIITMTMCAAALILSSCVTRIITTAEAPATVVYTQPTTRVVYGSSYVQPTRTTTIVKSSPSKTTTTVVNVTPLGEDVSFFLDLRAVGAAFAAANSLEEFEMLLNSSDYMLSSLDLNRDGYVDYLRVVEVIEGYNHVVVIQAVLAPNVFQDVATLTAEMSYSTPYVQIIGAPYIYGTNYYVRPVFVRTPPMFTYWRRPHYNPWRSPYYWDYYPHHYHKPAPVYLSHYQAYVNTYITNNRYCNRCEYDDRVHYADYSRTSSSVTRRDYETRHPEQSFQKRVASAESGSNGGGTSRTSEISNARDLQRRVASNSTTTTGTTSTSRTAQTENNAASTSRGSSASSTSRNASSTSGSSTTSTSRTTQTSGSTSTSSSSSSRGSSTTSSSSSTSTSRTTSTSSSSSSSSRKVTPASTTTTSRVSTSGTSRTTTKTVNTDGSSTTTRRGASSTSTSGSSRTSQTSSSSSSSRGSSSSSSSRGSSSSSSSRGSNNTTNTRR